MKELHWDQSHQSMGKKVLVASEKNTIAYLNANDGSIGESVIGIFRLSPYIHFWFQAKNVTVFT